MNICITGALGHIGSKLFRNLKIKNLDTVYLIDNLSTQRYCSLFDLPSKPRFKFYHLDILSKDIEPVIKKSEIVIHLAAITDAESSFDKKDLIMKVNQKGTEYIATLCAKHKTKLIFPSTTSVYGSQKTFVDENCQELFPQSPYAQSKLYCEKLLPKLSNKLSLHYTIIRMGTIYGYSIGMRFHTAVNKFIFQAVTGQSITVWKTAFHQKRPYCDLNDAVSAINHIINRNIFNNELYNIVSVNLTVEDIITIIKKNFSDLKIKFINSKIMNQLSYEVSNQKSINAGFTYNNNPEYSIKETISHLKNIYL